MLKPKSPQESFSGSYLYDRIVPANHLLRQVNQVVDFLLSGKYFMTGTILISGGRRKSQSSCYGCACYSIYTAIPTGRW